jgi:rhodanese-related sulfurtransferase
MSKPKVPRKRLTKRTIFVLGLLAVLLGGMLWDGCPLGALVLRQAVHLKFRGVRQVSPADLVVWMKDPNRPPPLLIDARPEDQFKLSHIEGAVRLDPLQPDLSPLEHVPRDQPVLVYDAAGAVGSAMVIGLTQAGFERVSNLDGGLFRWANEGRPIVGEAGPATKVHSVSWGWSRLLKARFRS